MLLTVQQHWVVPESIPTFVLVLAALVIVGVWVWLHFFRVRSGWTVWVLTMLKLLAGFVSLFAGAQVGRRFFVLATPWPIWSLALIGAIAVEAVTALYGLERKIVSRRWGACLLACRVAMVLTITVMLAQPVRSMLLTRQYQRYVAILVDDSASMHICDTQLTAGQKVRLAEGILRGAIHRPYRFERIVQRLDEVRQEIISRAGALAMLKDTRRETRAAYLESKCEIIRSEIATWRKVLASQLQVLSEPAGASGKFPLDKQTETELVAVKSELSARADDSLARAATRVSRGKSAIELGRSYVSLLSTYRRAAAGIAEILPRLSQLAQRLDEAYYRSLSVADRRKVDTVVGRTRYSLARDILLRGARDADGKALLDKCSGKYGLKLYTFSGRVSPVEPRSWSKKSDKSVSPADLPDSQQRTDISSALEKVAADTPSDRLVGVILLTDGRHNASQRIEPVARRLARHRIPIHSVVFGTERGPIDAAVVSVEAPKTVYLKDRTFITVKLKLDGLFGKKVRVRLTEANRTIATHHVQVPSDCYRTEIQLADEPKTIGSHAYKIIVDPQEGEVFPANNRYDLTVHVTSERTKMLLIESRPRWEFRYLKNLFVSRDRTVSLQYVLLRPDPIDGAQGRPVVHASANRPQGQCEATALPANENQWMKFDVIILGDVGPKVMKPSDIRILHKFVSDRGGTLIVIAGPSYMPHAWGATKIRDLVPVVFEPSEHSQHVPPEPSYKIALTPRGRSCAIMRLDIDEKKNLHLWDSQVELYWRYPNISAKPGATVLAYAMPRQAPKCMRQSATDEKTRLIVEEFQRSNPLIVHHNVSAGKVLFMGFDRTWRMRYRIGDRYHHKFWGQVLRWATAGKMAGESTLVKIGSDRSHYQPSQCVRIRARIVNRDFSPVISDDVSVRIFSDKKLVLTRKLQYVKDSTGMYSVDIGALAGGAYRAELDLTALGQLFDGEKTPHVRTHFSVDSTTPLERIELSADREVLAALASETSGIVVEPSRAGEIFASLGPGILKLHQKREYSLWDSWVMLVLIMVLATCEWLLRKKVSLA